MLLKEAVNSCILDCGNSIGFLLTYFHKLFFGYFLNLEIVLSDKKRQRGGIDSGEAPIIQLNFSWKTANTLFRDVEAVRLMTPRGKRQEIMKTCFLLGCRIMTDAKMKNPDKNIHQLSEELMGEYLRDLSAEEFMRLSQIQNHNDS